MGLGFISRILSRLGLIAVLAGLAPLSITLYDQLTCKQASARVLAVRGDRVLIEFATAEGQQVQTLSYVKKIGLEHPLAMRVTAGGGFESRPDAAKPGRILPILYRGVGNEGGPYVATPSWQVGLYAFAVFAAGALMFMFGTGLRRMEMQQA